MIPGREQGPRSDRHPVIRSTDPGDRSIREAREPGLAVFAGTLDAVPLHRRAPDLAPCCCPVRRTGIARSGSGRNNSIKHLTGTSVSGSALDTGRTVARHPLQATTVILSASPDHARRMQGPTGKSPPVPRLRRPEAPGNRRHGPATPETPGNLRPSHRRRRSSRPGTRPDSRRRQTRRPPRHPRGRWGGDDLEVPDQPYEPGRRFIHGLKRERETVIEAVVIGSRPKTPRLGNEHPIGAVEFGVREPDGSVRSIAWVSAWTDLERRAMTRTDRDGSPILNPDHLGRRALIVGQDEAARSRRLRHARLENWLDRGSSRGVQPLCIGTRESHSPGMTTQVAFQKVVAKSSIPLSAQFLHRRGAPGPCRGLAWLAAASPGFDPAPGIRRPVGQLRSRRFHEMRDARSTTPKQVTPVRPPGEPRRTAFDLSAALSAPKDRTFFAEPSGGHRRRLDQV